MTISNIIGGFFGFEEIVESTSKDSERKSFINDSVEYTLSGRAAYQLVLEDYYQVHGYYPRKVLLPDYCCMTMIEPFLEKKIPIQFYRVSYDSKLKLIIDNFDTSIVKANDIFVFMSYFGFSLGNDSYLENLLYSMKENNVVLVEDITHSYFNNKQEKYTYTDYKIASLRKWAAIASGGEARKINGKFLSTPYKESDDITAKQWGYMENKNEARYLEDYSKLYELNLAFNKSLSNFDWKYKIDTKSLLFWKQSDCGIWTNKRKNNSQTIISNFNDSRFEPMYNYEKSDVPLYLPYRYKGDIMQLKKELSENGIFLPTHWPIHFSGTSNLWEKEVSLVCDQRYCLEDMERMLYYLQK